MGKRKRTFIAALDQAEELWRASGLVADTVSPVLLFYSLTQAARAVCAAVIEGPQWQAIPSHGLSLLAPEIPNEQRPSISDIYVVTKRSGFVQQFADTSGSPHPPEKCTLAELLHALPEHEELLLPSDGHRQPLRVHDTTIFRSTSSQPSTAVTARVNPMPSSMVRRDEQPDGLIRMVDPEIDEVVEWFEAYPTLAGAGRPVWAGHVQPADLDYPGSSYSVELRWELAQPLRWGNSSAWFEGIVDVMVRKGAGVGASGLTLPSLGRSASAIKPVLTWWLALFASSMLVRYYPRTWASLLDVDSNRYAVPLSRFIDVGKRRVPSLILQELVVST